ncbi:hypothetical protein F5B22DRAFT_655585 [Xylaria bambusicola]|uniref:uncharacterized protein n=1 Tax=Xylaria bambusicola TaxID=326684 RepID=UPI002008AB9C|nr:uncharacterized protein F5B22DRAFT_655585 [Xylaria bambusicola]KAI0526420.1 hypothetical protein F5B22DRAFT_655585 [Xylaria bambusicola]
MAPQINHKAPVPPINEPIHPELGNGGTIGLDVVEAKEEAFDGQREEKGPRQASDTDNGTLAKPSASAQSFSSNPTSANYDQEGLVNALLDINIAALHRDATRRNKDTILSTGYIRPHPPSKELWDQVKRVHEEFPLPPAPEKKKETMPPANKSIPLDRHNRTMAAILTRFRNMVLAATEPLPTAAAIPQASLNAMTMNNEVSALIKEVENLLALNREIKQLWIAGPLRKPGDASEVSREKEIDEKAARVSDLYNTLLELERKTAKKSHAQQGIDPSADMDVKKEQGESHIKQEGGSSA